MKFLSLIYGAVSDLIIRYLPNFNKDKYFFAFLVHPRNTADIYRKYPFFRYFPDKFTDWAFRHFWPVVLSEVEGVKSIKNGKNIKGFVLTVPLTAKQMLEDRDFAVKRIIDTIKLAEKLGAKIVGLGALISSLTKGGLDLIDKVKPHITTGHALTAHTVTSNLFKFVELFKLDKNKVLVAIVGATGSIGSSCLKILARAGYDNFLLVDIERKAHFFENLVAELKKMNPDVKIQTSNQIRSIKEADFIITATNAPEAVVTSEDLKSGSVVVDDAQPSDVSPEVFDREDVIAVEGGLLHTPNIKNHFNFGLKDKYDNFSCMGEIMVLAAHEHRHNYVINKPTLENIDEISAMAGKMGIRLSEFQNAKEKISREKLARVCNIIKNNIK